MRYSYLKKSIVRTSLGVIVWTLAVAGIVTMMLTRAHYTVDIFVAALMTPLVYTNPVSFALLLNCSVVDVAAVSGFQFKNPKRCDFTRSL